MPQRNLYAEAAIYDVRGFYHRKFYSPGIYDPLASGQAVRHDIEHAKIHWMLANIPAGSRVLDVGCGCGNLNALRATGCEIVGADLSPLNCTRARANGYAAAVAAEAAALPFADGTFDAVVSLDVIGHIPFDAKDACIREWRRVLRRGGLQLHGIEADRAPYDGLSPEALAAFVHVDGHVGMEGQTANEARFRAQFANVESRFGFNIAMASQEVLKQHQAYSAHFQADPFLLTRVASFNADETSAWNLAMGFVAERLAALEVELPDRWGFLFLRASDRDLEADRYGDLSVSRLLRPLSVGHPSDRFHVAGGFHAAEGDGTLTGSFRWTTARAELLVPRAELYRVRIGASRPAPAASAVYSLRIDNGEPVSGTGPGDGVVTLRAAAASHAPARLVIESDTFVPAALGGSADTRALGVRVYWVDWA